MINLTQQDLLSTCSKGTSFLSSDVVENSASEYRVCVSTHPQLMSGKQQPGAETKNNLKGEIFIEKVFRCSFCFEEHYYFEPFYCDECGNTEFEEVEY